MLRLWPRAAGITAQGREVTHKEKAEQGEVLKFNSKVQSRRKALWNKCVAHRATCLSVKLVTCIWTLCYLQCVLFMPFDTENFLASSSENRLSLLCNLPWWVGAGISAAFPSACIHPPLQWFSNERHLFCNARHLHSGKCTWIYFGVQNYLGSFGWIFISSLFQANCLQVVWAESTLTMSRSGTTLVLLGALYHLPHVLHDVKSSVLLTKKILAVLYVIKMGH